MFLFSFKVLPLSQNEGTKYSAISEQIMREQEQIMRLFLRLHYLVKIVVAINCAPLFNRTHPYLIAELSDFY